jgi:hypothetical protein
LNYFAHGRAFLHDPYFLAGTAVPDWLSVVDRRMRVRSKAAVPFASHEDKRWASVAAGIVQHLDDDRWFHATRAFAELSLQFTRLARERLSDDEGFRPSFLGHILVELLLDATLIATDVSRLDEYYRALEGMDADVVGNAVNAMATRTSQLLPVFIKRFCAERFLYDYLEDAKLVWRLNHVMRRVNLPQLPESFANVLPGARRQVDARQVELLTRPSLESELES